MGVCRSSRNPEGSYQHALHCHSQCSAKIQSACRESAQEPSIFLEFDRVRTAACQRCRAGPDQRQSLSDGSRGHQKRLSSAQRRVHQELQPVLPLGYPQGRGRQYRAGELRCVRLRERHPRILFSGRGVPRGQGGGGFHGADRAYRAHRWRRAFFRDWSGGHPHRAAPHRLALSTARSRLGLRRLDTHGRVVARATRLTGQRLLEPHDSDGGPRCIWTRKEPGRFPPRTASSFTRGVRTASPRASTGTWSGASARPSSPRWNWAWSATAPSS